MRRDEDDGMSEASYVFRKTRARACTKPRRSPLCGPAYGCMAAVAPGINALPHTPLTTKPSAVTLMEGRLSANRYVADL